MPGLRDKYMPGREVPTRTRRSTREGADAARREPDEDSVSKLKREIAVRRRIPEVLNREGFSGHFAGSHNAAAAGIPDG
jgi:hypothetical protein